MLIDPKFKHLPGLQARLLTYKTLQKECGHRDGWRSIPYEQTRGLMQCMTCGLVAPEAELRKLERWVDETDYLEPNDALGSALSKWEGAMKWNSKNS